MKKHETKKLTIGASYHFPVQEGATVVNAHVLEGVHMDHDQTVSLLSLHDRIDRDGETQTIDDNPITKRLLGTGVTVESLGRYDNHEGIVTGPNYSPQDLENALRFARDKDVITTLEEHPLHMWNQAGSELQTPVVVNLYRSGEFKPDIAIKALRRALGRGGIAMCTVDADASKDTYVKLGVPASMIEVIHNGIDTERFKPSVENRAEIRGVLGIGQDDPAILLVGRDSPEKDIPLFLESARQYLMSEQKGQIIMAGTGLDLGNPNMIQMITKYFGDDEELMKRLHVLGARRDLEKLYNAADVLALTSATESRPLCISEAYAAGVRVAVSTNVGDSASMIGKNGIVTGRDPAEIAAAWQEAYARRDEIGYDINNRESLGMKPVVAKYARVIRAASA